MNRKQALKFTEIYDKYYILVYSTVYTKVSNEADANDISQEVFIRMYNKMDEIEDYKKWLYGTLKLVVFEYYRSKKKNESTDIDEIFNDVALTFVNGMRESRIIIESAFKQLEGMLTEEEQMVFELVAFFNYSYKETAVHTGLTKRKVEYRYRNIVSKVMDILKKQGINSLEELL
ncbi:MAG: sigma-70 family RNA polymerase sigma factor [Spirochaetes bacterium]|nr:sigma-70 family RNA polymerase sigma factor [Spirochaetota bacterium]